MESKTRIYKFPAINKNFIKFCGTGLLLGAFIALFLAFTIAYNNPSKSVVITINEYNEANIEMFVVMPLVSIMGIWAFILSRRDYLEVGKNKNKDDRK